MQIRTEGQHVDGCFGVSNAEAGVWDGPWAFLGAYKRRASDGSRRGDGYLWLVGVCNDTRCPALVLVRERDLVALVTETLDGGDDGE